jgi:hypothetical protein
MHNFNFFHYSKKFSFLFKDKITTNLIKRHLIFFFIKVAFRQRKLIFIAFRNKKAAIAVSEFYVLPVSTRSTARETSAAKSTAETASAKSTT